MLSDIVKCTFLRLNAIALYHPMLYNMRDQKKKRDQMIIDFGNCIYFMCIEYVHSEQRTGVCNLVRLMI